MLDTQNHQHTIAKGFDLRNRLRTAIDTIPNAPYATHIRTKAEAFLQAYEQALQTA